MADVNWAIISKIKKHLPFGRCSVLSLFRGGNFPPFPVGLFPPDLIYGLPYGAAFIVKVDQIIFVNKIRHFMSNTHFGFFGKYFILTLAFILRHES